MFSLLRSGRRPSGSVNNHKKLIVKSRPEFFALTILTVVNQSSLSGDGYCVSICVSYGLAAFPRGACVPMVLTVIPQQPVIRPVFVGPIERPSFLVRRNCGAPLATGRSLRRMQAGGAERRPITLALCRPPPPQLC